MKMTYAFIGVVLITLILGAWYLAPEELMAPVGSLPEDSSLPKNMSDISLLSSAFVHGASIPAKYTCDGERFLSPPLSISGVPNAAKSLVLIMDDPDVPKELIPDGVFDHWVVYNIPPDTREIREGAEIGTMGANGRDDLSYTGPCPPADYEPSEHRYVFRIFALDTELSFERPPTKSDVQKAMETHILARGELVGKYKRQ
jgi:Raf kinase inhibitor-like YbhB/YbcL family protein